ncbi:serine/threonine protein kinase [Acidocella aquatica]|uniref:Serine/threonine protein kinase n=1 Tax=Acidocella aquatica TaxID=1922313 RepID=A0ABQ6A6S8_9PROT|nr:serine/threonine-protein kinase [Acidocella aquatica]GLR67005.1 serine/threonine protein kinase [Acidocella aquatica]
MTEAVVSGGGWRIAAGFAATRAPGGSCHFYAVYEGAAFGQEERGILAALASAHPPPQQPGNAASAQLTVHSLAEGYFGAPRTLSAPRAASRALIAINGWLCSQRRTDSIRPPAPVSLSAVLFHQRHIGLAQIGACRLFRYRGQSLTPLMRDYAPPDGAVFARRAIGLEDEFIAEFAEEEAQPADRYILVAGAGDETDSLLQARLSPPLATASPDPAALAQSLLAAIITSSDDDKALMVLDIILTPPAGQPQPLTHLPLRPEPREGDVWDSFVLGKTLYRGRYTMLKAAYDTVGQREVALKIPLPAMLQDEIFAAGFMREAWIGTTVRGNTLAQYLDIPPERRSSLYLVMPLYKGETLEARLHRAPPVSLPEGLGIAMKLCEAVQDLAAIQIVHRDIKPDNIMLLAQTNEIRLLDLGLAYLPGIDTADAPKPGGTIRYMAPELLHGTAANARTEVYALGVTIYRMFTGGAFPFGQREATPLARLRPDLPPFLGACLARALAPKPAERYADAGELARTLQTGLITAPEPPPKPRRTLPFTPLHIWQGLALLFAIGFFFLLLRGLK